MIPLTAYVLPSITVYTASQIQGVVLRGVASSKWCWAGGSGSIKPAPDPLVDRIESILIDIRARTSPFGPDGRTMVQKTVFGWIISGSAGIAPI